MSGVCIYSVLQLSPIRLATYMCTLPFDYLHFFPLPTPTPSSAQEPTTALEDYPPPPKKLETRRPMIPVFSKLQLVLAFAALSLSTAAAVAQGSLESESTTSAPPLVTATSIAVVTAVQTSFTIVPGSSITSTDLITSISHPPESSDSITVATPSVTISSVSRTNANSTPTSLAVASTSPSSTVSLSVGSGANKGVVPVSSGFVVTVTSSTNAVESATASTGSGSGSALGAASNGAFGVYGSVPRLSAVVVVLSTLLGGAIAIGLS
ncbi:hypothetical protein DFH05DRAFT_1484409 [Lentinula detonsa]|uniref:Uncharacterized protein n=1 Tax=Lentinula detonsa TaxID=2804962 RepID=A0A9W8P3L3_9AGAR|nr:hypothetical protein DFH05DRAFT_1484409 [Lentinula detonsa]